MRKLTITLLTIENTAFSVRPVVQQLATTIAKFCFRVQSGVETGSTLLHSGSSWGCLDTYTNTAGPVMLIPWLQHVSGRVKLKNSSAVILPVSSLMKLQSWLLYKAAYPQSLHFCIFKVLNLSLLHFTTKWSFSESVFTRCPSRCHLKRLHRIFSVITLQVTSSSLFFFPTTFTICSVKNTKGTETNKEFITRLVILFKVSQLLSANIEVALEFWQNTPWM